MPLELWIAFTLAAGVVLTVPGPTVMLVVAYALSQGRASVWRTVPGVALGDLTAMTLSFLGLGALLAASATLFTVLKWVGAAYLVWLGVQLWRQAPTVGEAGLPAPRRGWAVLAHAYAVTALNPKGIVFFVAFLPQFIAPAAPVGPQLLLMGGTFLVLAIVNAALYGVLAGTVRQAVRRPAVLRAAHRAGGGALIAAGVATALARRAA